LDVLSDAVFQRRKLSRMACVAQAVYFGME
jgi:hypothetical protein